MSLSLPPDRSSGVRALHVGKCLDGELGSTSTPAYFRSDLNSAHKPLQLGYDQADAFAAKDQRQLRPAFESKENHGLTRFRHRSLKPNGADELLLVVLPLELFDFGCERGDEQPGTLGGPRRSGQSLGLRGAFQRGCRRLLPGTEQPERTSTQPPLIRHNCVGGAYGAALLFLRKEQLRRPALASGFE